VKRLLLLALPALALPAVPARGGPILFLVAERPGVAVHGDSYVLPLTEPADVAHARRLIAEGPDIGGAIAFAEIAAGADGVNRDHLAPGAPAWSWHVTRLLGFADITAEIYDGWPGEVERDVAGWIRNTDGRIGFWNYTVVAELGPAQQAAVPEPPALALLGLSVLGLAGYGGWRRRRPTRAESGSVSGRRLPNPCAGGFCWSSGFSRSGAETG
jgi:hypothetical protein